MNASILWCNSWENEEISDEVLAERVAELLNSFEGLRGFFAVSLSIDCHLMDRLPDVLVYQLREKGNVVVELTVKNLAMSSAMAWQHKNNQDIQQEMKSDRVRKRCIELLRVLDSKYVKDQLDILLDAINSKGAYTDFLNRWGYNKHQRLAIRDSIYEVAES